MKGSQKLWMIVALIALSIIIKQLITPHWYDGANVVCFIIAVITVYANIADYFCVSHYDDPLNEMIFPRYLSIPYWVLELNKWADKQSWLSDE